ncbi:MAG: replicative helicase [Alphaproteobacteria bacterium]|jgi:replicative DNA helicase|nr:replicative helicase [Alphaproteobacteria bacterium]
MDQDVVRQLPYDVDIEQALLGAILIDNYALERVSTVLKPEHFYDPLHQRLFDAIERMWAKGHAVTPLTLKALMEQDAGLAEVGGQAYLVSLARAAPAIPNVKDYARILADLAMRRELIRIGEDIVNTAFEAPIDFAPASQIEDAEKALYRVAEKSRFGEGPVGFDVALSQAVQQAEQALARGGHISGVPSGFTDLDSLLGGLHASDLIIVAGRPGMGKTSLATNMAFHASRMWAKDRADQAETKRGAPVLLFSLEMAASQLSARILSEQTEIDMRKLRTGRFSDSEWDRFVHTAQVLGDLPLYIDDTGGISIAQIAARARRLKREKQIGLIVVDYLQLVEPSTRRFENRVQEISDVTKGLKALAKELSVPVMALSQLSRGVDNRDDKRPILSDLRESGSIEQDADVVMFVYREEYYLKSREPEPGTAEYDQWVQKLERCHNRAEILVEKHRHGPTNKVELFFDERFTRFSNLASPDARS